LINTNEILGIRLTTIHNLYFLINLMKQIQAAIEGDYLLDLRDEFYINYGIKS